MSPGWIRSEGMYYLMNAGSCGTPITTIAACGQAASALGLTDTTPTDDGQGAWEGQLSASDRHILQLARITLVDHRVHGREEHRARLWRARR